VADKPRGVKSAAAKSWTNTEQNRATTTGVARYSTISTVTIIKATEGGDWVDQRFDERS